MMERVWVKEMRFRKRKNGKWSEWEVVGAVPQTFVTAYLNEPGCEKGECYEQRAVEYRRVEPLRANKQ